MPRKKKSISELYPKSKLVNKCLLKDTKRARKKPAVCEHNKIGYKDLMYLLMQSQKVVANLAKVLASVEVKFDDAKDTVEYITQSATSQIKAKEAQIQFLKGALIREGVNLDETKQ